MKEAFQVILFCDSGIMNINVCLGCGLKIWKDVIDTLEVNISLGIVIIFFF